MAIPNPTTPGVYIDEIATLGNSVVPVATAIPAFIGYVEKAKSVPSLGSDDLLNVPTRIESIKEFEYYFGKAFLETFVATVADDTTLGTRSITISTAPASPKYLMYYAMQMYFANGGGPCWIVAIGVYNYTSQTYTAGDFTTGLDAIAKIDEPTLLVFPDSTLMTSGYTTVATAALSQCNTLQDRFVIFDVPGATSTANCLASGTNVSTTFKGALGMSYLKYAAAYLPYLDSTLGYGINEAKAASLVWTVNGSASGLPTTIATLIDTAVPGDNDPSLYRQIIAKINDTYFVTLPPSGAMAGLYASVDRDRGVWKAPANVSVSNVTGPHVAITAAQQGDLNVDATTGKSINVIRAFTGKGTIVWGARTLAGNDNEWRYVPVRRLFNMAEESIKKATEFVVFEANDKNTWLRVKSMINNFLTDLWRQGALVGNKADQAFFVNVGLGETMTAQDILEGKLIIRIGMAAVRPAEFIILEFQHKLQEA